VNISLIMHELLVEGGGERQCLSLAHALVQQGHQVTLYTSAYDRANCFPEICKGLTIIETGRGFLPWLQKPFFIRGYFDMRRLVTHVDAKHQIWNPHHWPGQWGAVWLKRKSGGAVVWTCNDVPNFYEKAQGKQSLGSRIRSVLYRLYYLYDRAQNCKVDLTVFLSQWAESEFKAIYPVATRVVRSGADPERFKPGGDREKIRDRFGYKPDDFVLLWLGIFMPHRRLQDAIQAVSHLKKQGVPVKLLLAGSGHIFPDYFASLQTLVRDLSLQQEVTFEGKVADAEIRDFYCACDAFLFPNENQTWGLAVLEAMACGCPVLVSRGAAVHEVLIDQQTALLFQPRNPEDLARKIYMLMTQPQLRSQIAQNGMQMVRTTYNWEQFGKRMAAVFEEIVERRTPNEQSSL
jgi:glycosyltransferase involved in cell wall biosynthesis